MKGGGGCWGAGSQPMSTAVHRNPKKLWKSNSIFKLWLVVLVYMKKNVQCMKEPDDCRIIELFLLLWNTRPSSTMNRVLFVPRILRRCPVKTGPVRLSKL